MLLHKAIGLSRFNAMPRRSAVHALYECCCSVLWAENVAAARPNPDRETLAAEAAAELRKLSASDLDRVFDSVVREPISERTVHELARITRDRIDRMLGPEEGYPEY